MNSFQQNSTQPGLSPSGQVQSGQTPPAPEIVSQEIASPSSSPTTDVLGQEMKVGTGTEAKTGNTVTVHYVGTFQDGKKFDSSRDRGQLFTFQLGAGQVIKGWDVGVVGMKVGGIRKLIIPPNFAYGEAGQPPVIPPNSTLVFEVELLDVK